MSKLHKAKCELEGDQRLSIKQFESNYIETRKEIIEQFHKKGFFDRKRSEIMVEQSQESLKIEFFKQTSVDFKSEEYFLNWSKMLNSFETFVCNLQFHLHFCGQNSSESLDYNEVMTNILLGTLKTGCSLFDLITLSRSMLEAKNKYFLKSLLLIYARISALYCSSAKLMLTFKQVEIASECITVLIEFLEQTFTDSKPIILVEAYLQFGLILLEYKQVNKAAFILEEGVKLVETSKLSWDNPKLYFTLKYNLAVSLFLKDSFAQSIIALEDTLKLRMPEICVEVAKVYELLGDIYMSIKDFKVAAKNFAKAVELNTALRTDRVYSLKYFLTYCYSKCTEESTTAKYAKIEEETIGFTFEENERKKRKMEEEEEAMKFYTFLQKLSKEQIDLLNKIQPSLKQIDNSYVYFNDMFLRSLSGNLFLNMEFCQLNQMSLQRHKVLVNPKDKITLLNIKCRANRESVVDTNFTQKGVRSNSLAIQEDLEFREKYPFVYSKLSQRCIESGEPFNEHNMITELQKVLNKEELEVLEKSPNKEELVKSFLE